MYTLGYFTYDVQGLEEKFCSSKPYFCGFGVVSWGAVRMAGADRNVLIK